MRTEAKSYDLDGVIIGRPPFQFNALFRYYRIGNEIYKTPKIPKNINRRKQDQGFGDLGEAISYIVQSMRSVKPGVRQHLQHQAGDKYGNTGRPNSRPWVDMTRRTLQRGRVMNEFSDVFFKPPGIKSIQSKGHWLEYLLSRYNHVTHFDDNPADVLGLAKIFRNINFVIVQDKTTGILMSRIERRDYPNVQRIAVLKV